MAPASGAAVLVLLALLLQAAAPSSAASFKATVSNCTQLQAQLKAWGDKAGAGSNSYSLVLACPSSGARYDDCARPPQSGATLPAVIRVLGATKLSLEAAKGCQAGGARPRLSAAGPDDAADPDVRARFVVATGPRAALSLRNVVLDGLGYRPGVYLENAAQASLENVDLVNFYAASCDADPSARRGCGAALLTYATGVTIKGCTFANNMAERRSIDNPGITGPGQGAAIYAEAGAQSPGSTAWFSGAILTISNSTFKGNNATGGEGGAIFISKTSPKAVRVSCAGCSFVGNAGGNCSALTSARNDFVKSPNKPGAPLTINLGSGRGASAFSGNYNSDGSANAMCGSAALTMGGKFTPSSIPKAVTGLVTAPVTPAYNDFLLTQKP